MATYESDIAKALMPGVRTLIDMGVRDAQEAVIAEAVKDFEKRLRDTLARTALDIGRYVDMRYREDQLVITIKDTRKEPAT